MHLFRPDPPYFAGDCMPFWHDGVFHLYYLLDENHHQGLGGLGGHQWAHASTRDLLTWEQHPLALPITAEYEGSICTGSTFWHDGLYYAFYATRMRDYTQHLCMATSSDGVHFTKDPANPFASPPPGFGRFDLRDPFVFRDPAGSGFHLLATARLEPYPLADHGGCLLHYTSPNLRDWTVQRPFILPGGLGAHSGVPECPDLFEWNGWYYLLYSQRLETHYRYSRSPFGPWACPPVDLLDSHLAWVMKTAAFGAQRRLGVCFIGTRKDGLDSAPIQWAGNIVFRELVQHADGTLGTRFVPEMTPPHCSAPLSTAVEALAGEVTCQPAGAGGLSVHLSAPLGHAAARLAPLPADFVLRCTIHAARSGRVGLGLRAGSDMSHPIELGFDPALGKAWLGEQVIEGISGLAQPFTLEVRCQGDIIEACIDNRRCLVNRLPEAHGDALFFLCEDGEGIIQQIQILAIE
jgi:hypothetical protein